MVGNSTIPPRLPSRQNRSALPKPTERQLSQPWRAEETNFGVFHRIERVEPKEEYSSARRFGTLREASQGTSQHLAA